MASARPRTLLAVLSNPPLTDGRRTLQRVELAVALLGFDRVVVGNLFAFPSHATGAISALGLGPEGWATARAHLDDHLAACGGALVALGFCAPSGYPRYRSRRLVGWRHDRTLAVGLPTWQVGDGPRHPSRWQRWTSRAHPDLAFPDALRTSLVRVEPPGDQRTAKGAAKIETDVHRVQEGS